MVKEATQRVNDWKAKEETESTTDIADKCIEINHPDLMINVHIHICVLDHDEIFSRF